MSELEFQVAEELHIVVGDAVGDLEFARHVDQIVFARIVAGLDDGEDEG